MAIMVLNDLKVIPFWCYNETEKRLTEDEFMEICDRYMQELEIEGGTEFLSLEYYG